MYRDEGFQDSGGIKVGKYITKFGNEKKRVKLAGCSNSYDVSAIIIISVPEGEKKRTVKHMRPITSLTITIKLHSVFYSSLVHTPLSYRLNWAPLVTVSSSVRWPFLWFCLCNLLAKHFQHLEWLSSRMQTPSQCAQFWAQQSINMRVVVLSEIKMANIQACQKMKSSC